MRIPNLRRALALIVLSAPACVDPGGCPPTEDFVLLGELPDSELDPLIETCKTQQSCEPLCSKVFERKYGFAPDVEALLECSLTVDGESSQDLVHYVVERQCIGGRRPAGFRGARGAGPAVAAYLAQQAELEAASVRAFSDLHDDLRALGAPAWLLRAIIAAAADEVRHANTCDLLARAHGGAPDMRMVCASPRRARHQIATDNLVEGCVRETYGAVLAGYQARTANDPAVRAAMRRIAHDETKHAALSWKLHQWLWPQLSADEQRDAVAAAAAARAELALDPGERDAELRTIAGLPDAVAASAMLAQLDATVWSAI